MPGTAALAPGIAPHRHVGRPSWSSDRGRRRGPRSSRDQPSVGGRTRSSDEWALADPDASDTRQGRSDQCVWAGAAAAQCVAAALRGSRRIQPSRSALGWPPAPSFGHWSGRCADRSAAAPVAVTGAAGLPLQKPQSTQQPTHLTGSRHPSRRVTATRRWKGSGHSCAIRALLSFGGAGRTRACRRHTWASTTWAVVSAARPADWSRCRRRDHREHACPLANGT